MESFSQLELKRYNRQIILNEVGEAGQKKLKESRVLIVGTGGLGSPNSLYLAAAGVGTIGLIDDDVVDASNLQRQIVHSTDELENPKVESAERRLSRLNPFIQIKVWEERFSVENGLRIARDFDLIIDGTDNLETRKAINQVSLELDIPYVYGAVYQFEGQVSIFNYRGGPCYHCLYGDVQDGGGPPPGIFGVVPGVIGSLQATEALKILIGMGSVSSGVLLSYDALESSFRRFNIERKKDCPVCGGH